MAKAEVGLSDSEKKQRFAGVPEELRDSSYTAKYAGQPQLLAACSLPRALH